MFLLYVLIFQCLYFVTHPLPLRTFMHNVTISVAVLNRWISTSFKIDLLIINEKSC